MENFYSFVTKRCILLCVGFLLAFTDIYAQDVVIPDPAFKSRLIQLGVDTSDDGEIQFGEAAETLGLDLANSEINFLGGLEAFINIGSLDISGNNIEFLDITPLTQIFELNCSNNPLQTVIIGSSPTLFQLELNNTTLQELNLSGCTGLQSLFSENSSLASLNLSGCTALVQLQVVNSLLSSIDLSGLSMLGTVNLQGGGLMEISFQGNSALTNLNVDDNMLFSLDVTEAPNLQTLYCQHNNIATLTLTNNAALLWLACAYNSQMTLDVTHSPLLEVLNASNNSLQSIFMKNGADEDNVVISDNPNLSFICADETQIQNIQNIAGPSVVVNSYCSFSPGGDYNTITGTVRYDLNGNGCDASDVPQSFIKLHLIDGNQPGYTFTSAAGTYNFYTQQGNFSLNPMVENPSFFTFSPQNANIEFPDNNDNQVTQNFCVAANGVHHDVEVAIAPIVTAQPGFNAVYKVVYKNKGNQPASGTVTFEFEDSKMDLVSAQPVPNTTDPGILNFNYSNLLPFESREITITLNINSPTDTPSVNIDDILNFSASIALGTADELPADNLFSYNQTVIGGFDPNNKQCIEGAVVSPDAIGDYLHYVINFENTGNAPVQNIIIKDSINSDQFNIETLQVLNSSNPVIVRVNGNVVEFIFNNIQLGSGGHGNILMKIKSLSTLTVGSTVSNEADIFFDYNAPVATDAANTQFQSLAVADHSTDPGIEISPNPTQGKITINADDNLNSIQLFDVQGRLLQVVLPNAPSAQIDLSRHPIGIYFLRVTSDNGTLAKKIIKN